MLEAINDGVHLHDATVRLLQAIAPDRLALVTDAMAAACAADGAYRLGSMDELFDHWVPLASLINNLNRAVGQHDAYPFVLTPQVVAKLGFIQKIVRAAGAVQWTVPGPGGVIPINTPAT